MGTLREVATLPQVAAVDDHTGWWQGYDSADEVWKYVLSDTPPDENVPGWVDASEAFPAMEAQAAELDFTELYLENLAETIANARTAGLSVDDYPDDLIEGTIVLMVDGKPPVTVRAGEVFFTERGQIHNARNIGTTTARAVDTYVIDKGKPGITPAP